MLGWQGMGDGKNPFRATNAANWSSIIRMHVERFRVTLNGLGGFHMGIPASIAEPRDNHEEESS